jgi:hypothetical protein
MEAAFCSKHHPLTQCPSWSVIVYMVVPRCLYKAYRDTQAVNITTERREQAQSGQPVWIAEIFQVIRRLCLLCEALCNEA